jgi:hypothetical protein
MHIIFNELYNYYISNKFLLEECDEEENVGVTGAANKFILKRFEHVLSSVTYSPIYRQVSPKDEYPVSTPDLCKIVLLAVLFGSNGSSYTVSKQSDMCVYEHMFFTI